jgi:hypothetical protein
VDQKKFEKCAAGVAIALQEAWNVYRWLASKAVATPVTKQSRGGARAFSSEVDTGSREENASNQKMEPRSDSIRTEKALASSIVTFFPARNAASRLRLQ